MPGVVPYTTIFQHCKFPGRPYTTYEFEEKIYNQGGGFVVCFSILALLILFLY